MDKIPRIVTLSTIDISDLKKLGELEFIDNKGELVVIKYFEEE